MGECPVCKSPWKCDGFDLSGSIVTTEKGTVWLSYTQATMVNAMIKRPVSKDGLIDAVYFQKQGPPLTAGGCIRVYLTQIKKKIEPLGYTISNLHAPGRYCALYALHKMEDAHDGG